jgi:GcrA cell cycle regulator
VSERLVAPRPRPVPAPAALAPEVLAEAMQPVAVASVPVPVVAEPEWERTASNVQPLRPGVTEQGAGIIPARAAPQTVSAEPAPLRTVSATPTPRRRGLTCCWPLGEPGTKEFHFCGGDPAPGKPYCSQHAALAYVKLRDRRDSVA